MLSARGAVIAGSAADRGLVLGRRARAARRERWVARPYHEHLLAAALLALVVVVYLWPALVDGRILSADSILYSFAPWRSGAPHLPSQVNTLLSDVPEAYYPWDVFIRHALHEGVVPTWNNLSLAGTPIYTNPQTGLLSLLSLPLWLLPLGYAFGVIAAIKLWLAGLGTYLLVRQLKLGFWPALLAGVSFAFCSFNIGWLGHQSLPAVSAWLPWAILFVERTIARARPGDFVGLALVCAFALDGGHPGTELHVFLAAGLYGLIRAATVERLGHMSRARRLILAASGMTLGALLTAVLVVPVIVAGGGTMGQAARAGGGGVLPLAALRTAMFPAWWGQPGSLNLGGPDNFIERTVYAGSIALLLACVSICHRAAWRRKAPLVALAVVGLAVPFGLPIVHSLVTSLPLLDSVTDSRMILLFMFAVSVLAAFGLEALIDADEVTLRRAEHVVGVAVLAGVVAMAFARPTPLDLADGLEGIVDRGYTVAGVTSVYWWLMLAAVTALLLQARQRSGRRLSATKMAIALTLLAAGDMLHFAHGFQTTEPPAVAVPRTTPALTYLRQNVRGTRIVALDDSLPGNSGTVFGLADVRGYDPPQPSLRYLHLWQRANPHQGPTVLALPAMTDVGSRVLSALGAHFVVTAPNDNLEPWRTLKPVYRGTDATVYRNDRAAAGAVVPSRIEFVTGEQGSLAAITSPTFDPRRDAVVEAGGPSARALNVAKGTVTVQVDQNNTARLAAQLSRGGLVVLNDAWAEGWTVAVDGHRRPLLRVDDVMRGVQVPAGSHVVSFRYSVPGLGLGIVLSVGALLVLLAIIGVSGWRHTGRNRMPR